MKKRTKIIEFPIEKTLEIEFMLSLSTKQCLQFYQIMDNISNEAIKNNMTTFNNMLNYECKKIKEENVRLKKIIGRLIHQKNKN